MIVYSKSPSKNKKIAKIDRETGQPLWPYVFATYREVGPTCPMRCGFHPERDDAKQARVHGKRCYARTGNVNMHQRRGTPDETDGERIYRWVQGLPEGALVRLHVSGDAYKKVESD